MEPSSGSNVIPRRARPGLAGLGPHREPPQKFLADPGSRVVHSRTHLTGTRASARPKPHNLHPISYTLHPTTHTLHPTPYTLQPTPYTLFPTPNTLHPTPYTLHPTPYTLPPTPYNPVTGTQLDVVVSTDWAAMRCGGYLFLPALSGRGLSAVMLRIMTSPPPLGSLSRSDIFGPDHRVGFWSHKSDV